MRKRFERINEFGCLSNVIVRKFVSKNGKVIMFTEKETLHQQIC